MAHLHLNELISLICDMWLNKVTYLLTYHHYIFVNEMGT